jgi:hypothetical protein
MLRRVAAPATKNASFGNAHASRGASRGVKGTGVAGHRSAGIGVEDT